jgi:hypothetical protein
MLVNISVPFLVTTIINNNRLQKCTWSKTLGILIFHGHAPGLGLGMEEFEGSRWVWQNNPTCPTWIILLLELSCCDTIYTMGCLLRDFMSDVDQDACKLRKIGAYVSVVLNNLYGKRSNSLLEKQSDEMRLGEERSRNKRSLNR